MNNDPNWCPKDYAEEESVQLDMPAVFFALSIACVTGVIAGFSIAVWLAA